MKHTAETFPYVAYNGTLYTLDHIKAMREWISDCQWADLEDVSELSDYEVLAGIDRNVDGGLREFVNNMM